MANLASSGLEFDPSHEVRASAGTAVQQIAGESRLRLVGSAEMRPPRSSGWEAGPLLPLDRGGRRSPIASNWAGMRGRRPCPACPAGSRLGLERVGADDLAAGLGGDGEPRLVIDAVLHELDRA